ncbi:unnamed protein product [Dracunculus medinensis]|uniref:GP-PDE domain-containing protein n=1 Tax=Dracunculus medinensis TaxID=318479 RepID=A0A0N4UDE0_DRAME|nr:unnamed protein product [Dracunculus medinensis]
MHPATIHFQILSSDEPLFHEQSLFGEEFKVGRDYFVFRTRSVAVAYLGFRLELFLNDCDNLNSLKRFAVAYAMPNAFPGDYGVASVNMMSKHDRPIGLLRVDYLFMNPLLKDVQLSMAVRTFSRHWKKRQALEVGHRGMGNSYTKMAAGRENTISSLNSAASKGADYVEFDVQLSKDKIAVIFHDFHVLVTVAKRDLPVFQANDSANDLSSNFHEMAVKDLKLKQLQLLRVSFHLFCLIIFIIYIEKFCSNSNSSDHFHLFPFQLEHRNVSLILCRNDSLPKGSLRLTAEADEAAENHPFPTLVEALQRVDPSVGFNIEIKYPMMQRNGEHECENYFKHNEYIDIILSDVFKYAGDRRILFSSFDPDICALINAKQQQYPVLFLCLGLTTRYEPFVDLRASSSNSAVNFAASLGILGVNFNSEDLLRDPSPIERARHFGLVSFVWGDDLNCKERIDYFKKVLLVDGVIYDRIGEICGERRNVFLIEREAKTSLFKQGVSPTSLDDTPSSPTISEKSVSSYSSTVSSISPYRENGYLNK